MRRTEAHTLKVTHQRRTKVRVQQAKEVLRSGARALIVERPIRALWRKRFDTTKPVPLGFIKRHTRWSKAEMDYLALGG